MNRPTPEQIAEAHRWFDRACIDGLRRQHAISADMIEVLLAATAPCDQSTGYCQLCRINGNVAEHQCFFGPVDE